jgi:hypothetical protein
MTSDLTLGEAQLLNRIEELQERGVKPPFTAKILQGRSPKAQNQVDRAIRYTDLGIGFDGMGIAVDRHAFTIWPTLESLYRKGYIKLVGKTRKGVVIYPTNKSIDVPESALIDLKGSTFGTGTSTMLYNLDKGFRTNNFKDIY